MIAYYLQIKHAHIAFALLSGGLFALRGLLVLAGRGGWARAAALRYLSYGNDTLLLTAALMLLATLQLDPFATPWLAVKLTVLLVYIVLGVLALREGAGRGRALAAYLAAIACFAFMVSVARAHHPLGFLAAWLQ